MSRLVMTPGRLFFDFCYFRLDTDCSAFMRLVAALAALHTGSAEGFLCG